MVQESTRDLGTVYAHSLGLSLSDSLFSGTPLSLSSSCGSSSLCPLVTQGRKITLLSELQLFYARSHPQPASRFYIYNL